MRRDERVRTLRNELLTGDGGSLLRDAALAVQRIRGTKGVRAVKSHLRVLARQK